jgi:hypothetical protein
MRMVLVAGLLMLALLGAVLGSIGTPGPAWVSARDNAAAEQRPARDTMRGPFSPG